MTDELQSIRERFDAIIPGPWRWFGNTATDQVYLATTDRGRLIILSPEVRKTEYVYNHDEGESYPLHEISNTDVRQWCGIHDDEERLGDKCICEEIAAFLRPTDEPEALGYASLAHARVQLTRGLTVHPDLRFPDDSERRKERGGMMRSYRNLARYEVLGRKLADYFSDYRTRAEYEAEETKPVREALYREDFIGLANPEATFIEHAPEDVGFLLNRVETLEAEIVRLHGVLGAAQKRHGEQERELAELRERHSKAVQGTWGHPDQQERPR